MDNKIKKIKSLTSALFCAIMPEQTKLIKE